MGIPVGIIYVELRSRGFFPCGNGDGGKSSLYDTSGRGTGKYPLLRRFPDPDHIIYLLYITYYIIYNYIFLFVFMKIIINILKNEELSVDHFFHCIMYCFFFFFFFSQFSLPPKKVNPLHTVYTPSPILPFSILFSSFIPHLLCPLHHHHHNNQSPLFIVLMVITLQLHYTSINKMFFIHLVN